MPPLPASDCLIVTLLSGLPANLITVVAAGY
jgi:hypothetical protein